MANRVRTIRVGLVLGWVKGCGGRFKGADGVGWVDLCPYRAVRQISATGY